MWAAAFWLSFGPGGRHQPTLRFEHLAPKIHGSWAFFKMYFCHQSGRRWPDSDDTSGFESRPPGAHFGPIPGPWGAPKNPEKIQKLFGKILKFLEFWSHVFKPGATRTLQIWKQLKLTTLAPLERPKNQGKLELSQNSGNSMFRRNSKTIRKVYQTHAPGTARNILLVYFSDEFPNFAGTDVLQRFPILQIVLAFRASPRAPAL